LFLRTAVEEMGHVERCAERILFLGGDVEMVASETVKKIQDVKEMLEMSRQMEQGSIRDYNLWANECSANADSGTKKVFEGLVDEEEIHYDQYDTEKDNLTRFGDRYLALQSIEKSKNMAAGAPAE
jgi:bacterioferritin